MPYNPSTSRAECNYHAGLVNQDSKNQPQTSNRESYNTFDKRHTVADTQLFDEVRPFYMDVANSGDVKRARMVNNDWSPVTKSQILSDIKKHRALFQVPWSAIMPNTWEYLFREPVQGSDINFQNVAPLLSKTSLINLIGTIFDFDYSSSDSVQNSLELLIKSVWLHNCVFGNSGLLNTLGIRPFNESAFVNKVAAPAKVVDSSPSAVFSRLCEVLSSDVTVGDVTISLPRAYNFMPSVVSTSSGSSSRYHYELKSPSDAFNFVRDFVYYTKSLTLQFTYSGDFSQVAKYVLFGDLTSTYQDYIYPHFTALPADYCFNFMPAIAYQCVWHQFFTNDRVDAVYSARMWQESLFSAFFSTPGFNFKVGDFAFFVNGVRVSYDCCSAAVVSLLFSGPSGTASPVERFVFVVDYLNEIFSIRPSMRGSDYFTSMRVQPLAVGNVDVTVNAGKVSAIDVNKSLWYQRFLNAVNRTKQSIYDYLQSITGVRPERVEPQPNFIVEEVFNLAGMQVENNSESQGRIVSIFRNTQSNYVYDIFIDEPSIIIGVDSYSASLVYTDFCNKIAFMSDRLDWFNDFMQHIGDQQVSLRELLTPDDLSTVDRPIGYQLRYAEFKNMVSRAAGGFLSEDSDLASWLVSFRPGIAFGSLLDPARCTISPYFIRNHASDFDLLFDSLTGTNPSNRYHVVKYTFVDEMDNSKQQAYPSLL